MWKGHKWVRSVHLLPRNVPVGQTDVYPTYTRSWSINPWNLLLNRWEKLHDTTLNSDVPLIISCSTPPTGLDKSLPTDVPLFEFRVNHSVRKSFTTDPDAFQYAVTLQLVQYKLGIENTWCSQRNISLSLPQQPCNLIYIGERSIAISLSVCVSVCLSASISLVPLDRSSRNFLRIPCGRGSDLLWRRCDTLCTSGFMDDFMFGRNGPYGDAWKAGPLTYYQISGVAIPGRSLMSMNALLRICCTCYTANKSTIIHNKSNKWRLSLTRRLLLWYENSTVSFQSHSHCYWKIGPSATVNWSKSRI